MMKRILVLGMIMSLFINCGGSDSEVVPPPSEDKVTAVNDSFEVIEDTPTVLSNFLDNDTYTTGSVKITFEANSIKEGTITLSDNKFTYTPSPTFIGEDSFKYTICSTITTTNCSTGTINITVLDAGNPEAADDAYETNKNQVLTINDYLDNDTIVDSAEVESVNSSTSSGTVVLNNDGTISYTPQTDFIGQDTFTYTLCDNDNPNTCSTATITITIKSSGGNTGSFNIPSALQSYYNDVDFSLTGSSLKDALATKVINSHTSPVTSYTPGVWNVLKQSDLDPEDNSKVLLIYGYNDDDGDYVTDRTRDKNETGGTQNEDWNREHVYAKSLGTPRFDNDDTPGSDPHHLRASDVKMNSNRGNKKFAAGSGNAGDVSGGWYPGEEWKGDVARMMMYMYLRYGSQCLPKNVTVGTANSSDSNMINLLLEWNKEDPVSEFEKNRNDVIAAEQGNRNPIIDNPYLATLIWGGDAADNTWD